ncbi:uncharacterized protein LOC125237232 isoform X1 [Leguminivora glycinivorella]|uniref:uncharacterized protein LOC125237232 isoform X1 n=1 Tax=Leguminivora glycinivorella TaxID=1035111 RepID=UPI00200C0087|nr:uncharacterized protein LOC125237232 isoform X1 [Leguminivora glycinivorella]
MKKMISSSSQGSTTVENKSKRQNNITSAISVTVDPTNDGATLSTTPPIARSTPELGSDGAVLSAGGLTSSGACGERAIPRSPLLPVPAAAAAARCAARQPVAASCSRASCNSFSVCTQDQGQMNKLLSGSDNIPDFNGDASSDMTVQCWKKLLLGTKCDQPDHVITDVIIFTLNDPLLTTGARGAACRDTKSLLKYLTDSGFDCSNKSKASSVSNDVGRSYTGRKQPQRDDVTCYKCGIKGHISSICTKTDVKQCDRCSKYGHVSVDCKEHRHCTSCDKWGHVADNCIRKKDKPIKIV